MISCLMMKMKYMIKGVKTKCDFLEQSDVWYNSLSKRTLTTLEDKKRLKTKCA